MLEPEDDLMRWKQFLGVGLASCFVLISVSRADAASSLSDPLTGFTGDSSQAGTQSALATAGFTVFGTGAPEAITYGASGATFGAATAGDGGRNYMRTSVSDYAGVKFVA